MGAPARFIRIVRVHDPTTAHNGTPHVDPGTPGDTDLLAVYGSPRGVTTGCSLMHPVRSLWRGRCSRESGRMGIMLLTTSVAKTSLQRAWKGSAHAGGRPVVPLYACPFTLSTQDRVGLFSGCHRWGGVHFFCCRR